MSPQTVLRAATVAALSLLLVGCERHSNSEKYYLIGVNMKLPYWQTAAAGLTGAAGKLQVKSQVSGPDTYDPQAEVAEMRNAVAAKATGILVSPADPKLMAPEIDAAIQAGIPTLTVDSDAPGSKRLFFIGTNNYQAGVMSGQATVKYLPKGGNVVIFTMPNQLNLDERLQGFHSVADKKGIKVVEVVNIQGDPRIAFDKTTQFLGRTGKDKIDGFVCLEASAGQDVAEVIRRENAKNRVIVAFDTDQPVLNGIQDGTIAATIAQKPYTMADVGLKMLDSLHHNKLSSLTTDWATDLEAPVPQFVDTGVVLVEKGNVGQFLHQGAGAQQSQ